MAITWIPVELTIQSLTCSIRDGQYLIDVEHQRDNIQTKKWKSKIIETIFTFGYIPPTLWHKKENGKYASIDGKQRITAILEFGLGGFPFNKKLYRDLSREMQNQFLNFKLTLVRCDVELNKQTIDFIFSRIQESKPASLGELVNCSHFDIVNSIRNYISTDEWKNSYNGETVRMQHFGLFAYCLYAYAGSQASYLGKVKIEKFFSRIHNDTNNLATIWEHTLILLTSVLGCIRTATVNDNKLDIEDKQLFAYTTICPLFIFLKQGNVSDSNRNVIIDNLYEITEKWKNYRIVANKNATLSNKIQIIHDIRTQNNSSKRNTITRYFNGGKIMTTRVETQYSNINSNN